MKCTEYAAQRYGPVRRCKNRATLEVWTGLEWIAVCAVHVARFRADTTRRPLGWSEAELREVYGR